MFKIGFLFLVCNCRGGIASCPHGGKCISERNIVYACKVTRLDDNTYETYTGLTDNTFKQRYYGHKNDFSKKKNRKKTMLSKYIWFLKDNNIQYDLSWGVLGKAKSFNPVTGVCRLCLLEKYFTITIYHLISVYFLSRGDNITIPL